MGIDVPYVRQWYREGPGIDNKDMGNVKWSRVVDVLDVASHKLCRGFDPLRISAGEQASAACQRTDRLPVVAAVEFAGSREPAAAVRSCSLQGESYQPVTVAWQQRHRVS